VRVGVELGEVSKVGVMVSVLKVRVGVNVELDVGVGVPKPAVSERSGVGVAVGVMVAVSFVEVGVKRGVEDASRPDIWGTIAAASGLLSSQDWTSVWSIFSIGGTLFVSDETIFCPEVRSTSPAAS
jgi:hypothetical protein